MDTQWFPSLLFIRITTLAGTLDARRRARSVQLCGGRLFARGRRTVASWLRATAVGRDYQRSYDRLSGVGRKATAVAGRVLRILQDRLPPDREGTPMVFIIDDSPTKRLGPQVEGAGKPHNPTPGTAGSKFLHSDVWVGLAR